MVASAVEQYGYAHDWQDKAWMEEFSDQSLTGIVPADLVTLEECVICRFTRSVRPAPPRHPGSQLRPITSKWCPVQR